MNRTALRILIFLALATFAGTALAQEDPDGLWLRVPVSKTCVELRSFYRIGSHHIPAWLGRHWPGWLHAQPVADAAFLPCEPWSLHPVHLPSECMDRVTLIHLDELNAAVKAAGDKALYRSSETTYWLYRQCDERAVNELRYIDLVGPKLPLVSGDQIQIAKASLKVRQDFERVWPGSIAETHQWARENGDCAGAHEDAWPYDCVTAAKPGKP